MDLFTIGHSNHPIDAFLALLKQHEISAIADVRSHPYSRYLPHFSQTALKQSLQQQGIYYVFLGKELGARPQAPECYVNGKALYDRIAQTDGFQQGLQRIIKGVQAQRIALMCAEQDPLTCHRAILIGQHLRQADLTIQHILKTGDLESQAHLEERLLAKYGLSARTASASPPPVAGFGQLTLFNLGDVGPVHPESGDRQEDLAQKSWGDRETCLKEAYRRWGDEIAYVEPVAD